MYNYDDEGFNETRKQVRGIARKYKDLTFPDELYAFRKKRKPEVKCKQIFDCLLEGHQKNNDLVVMFKYKNDTICADAKQEFMIEAICKYIEERMRLDGTIFWLSESKQKNYRCLADRSEKCNVRACQAMFGKHVFCSFEMTNDGGMDTVRDKYVYRAHTTQYDDEIGGNVDDNEVLDIILWMSKTYGMAVSKWEKDGEEGSVDYYDDFGSTVALASNIVSMLKKVNYINDGYLPKKY